MKLSLGSPVLAICNAFTLVIRKCFPSVKTVIQVSISL